MIEKKIISKYIHPLSTQKTSLERSGNLDGKIICILFDIYGTLFISGSGDIGLSKQEQNAPPPVKYLFEAYGIQSETKDVLQAFHQAIENRHRLLLEKGVDFPEVRIDEVWMEVLGISDGAYAKKFAAEFEMITNPVYPMPNLQKVLSVLKNKKIYMGIISNAQFYTPYLFDWFLGATIDDLGFNDDLVFFSYEESIAKPSMRLFHLATGRLIEMGIDPGQVLYIGNDMRNDILPAKESGFKTALFAGDARSLRLRNDISKCREISPDLIITDLVQLLDVV